MRKKLLCLSMAAVMSAAILPVATSGTLADSPAATNYQQTIFSTPSDENIVNLLDGNVYEFASDYELYKSENYYDGTDQYAPKPVTLSWESESGAQYYVLNLSKNADMSNPERFVTLDTSLQLENLFMGTKYYYQVIAVFADKTVKSRIFKFETAYLPRTIYVEGISNTRDMGGYYTTDGNRIRQGMVFRGGLADDASKESLEKFIREHGIKTDLDLRKEVSKSPFGSSVNFVNVSGPYYVEGNGILNESYKQALITEVKTFANPENYPIYVHCSLGRDRTGTICFLISALCGVDKMDLFLDYEMSFFSVKGCLDGASPTYLVRDAIGSLYSYLKGYSEGKTLAEKTAAYMRNELGITQEEIDTIRSIMIEEVAK